MEVVYSYRVDQIVRTTTKVYFPELPECLNLLANVQTYNKENGGGELIDSPCIEIQKQVSLQEELCGFYQCLLEQIRKGGEDQLC